MNSSSFVRTESILVLGTWLGLMGCAGKPAEAPGPAPPTVTVSYPLQRDVTEYQVYTGRTAAIDSVQIRARVSGYLQKLNFQDGAEVKKGDVLCEIDSRPYQATYDATKALVARNVANLELARQNNERYKRLFKADSGAVSRLDIDQYQSAEDQAVAELNQSMANQDSAKLNLDWTKVTAPVSGQISYRLVTPGNLVSADLTTLTTIVSQDPIWVYFSVDEPTVVRIRQLVREGKIQSERGKVSRISALVALTGEQGFPHQGHVDFSNNQLDQATATLLVRAVLSNPMPSVGDRVFAPAMFVRVRLPIGPPYRALLVSEAAVGTDQNLRYLYVVNEQNKVVRHTVQLGSVQNGLQIIAAGLKPSERVIIDGLQHVQPGAVVNPKVLEMPVPDNGGEQNIKREPVAIKTAAPGPKR